MDNARSDVANKRAPLSGIIHRQRAAELQMQVHWLNLTALSTGTINPWYAPAIRGLVTKPLRDHYCSAMGGYIDACGSRESKGYCQGCVKNASCAYGRDFEPDLRVMAPESIRFGAQQGLRGVTFASPVLAAPKQLVRVESGAQLPLRILTLGNDSMADVVVEVLDSYGKSSGLWGQPALFFEVNHKSFEHETFTLDPTSLPTTLCVGRLPEVQLTLSTPLSLKRKENQHRDLESKRCYVKDTSPSPTFRELVGQCLRTVSRAIVEYADSSYLANTSLREFLAPASDVPVGRHELTFFHQQRSSRRRAGNHEQSGWLGSITFRDVPLAYLPWLHWAGLLGFGDSRNCGAGLWRIHLSCIDESMK